jgi:SP family sugar:H+ symporter-like MFS transporter
MFFSLFIPDSPRWLLSKDRESDAVASLLRLRPKGEDMERNCAAEIQAIKEALQDRVHKAPWVDLVRGNNLRRTLLILAFYFFQQVRTSTL